MKKTGGLEMGKTYLIRKVARQGSSLRVTIPSEFVKELNLKAGDYVAIEFAMLGGDIPCVLIWPLNEQKSIEEALEKQKRRK